MDYKTATERLVQVQFKTLSQAQCHLNSRVTELPGECEEAGQGRDSVRREGSRPTFSLVHHEAHPQPQPLPRPCVRQSQVWR